MKKYLTLGAVLAGSAFMVSCDSDDDGLADAINAQTAQAAADSAAAAAAAAAQNNDRLPFNTLPVQFLQAARLSAIVHSVSITEGSDCVWPCGGELEVVEPNSEFTVDFESSLYADFYCGGSNHANNMGDDTNTDSINNLEIVSYTTTDDTFTFSLKERGANGELVFDEMTFTVDGKLDYTLFGTFTSGSTTCTEPNLNIEDEHSANAATTAAAAALFTNLDSVLQSNATLTSSNTIEVNDRDNVQQSVLPLETVIVKLDDDGVSNEDAVYALIISGGEPATGYDVSSLQTQLTAGTVPLVSGFNAAAQVNETTWIRICSTQTGCVVTGDFRVDLNPSQGGIDEIVVDGLIDDWLSENMGEHSEEGDDDLLNGPL